MFASDEGINLSSRKALCLYIGVLQRSCSEITCKSLLKEVERYPIPGISKNA